jgi:hypothetical protein
MAAIHTAGFVNLFRHTWYDAFGRVIGKFRRPLPTQKTQHSNTMTNINDLSEIRTHDINFQAIKATGTALLVGLLPSYFILR